MHRPGQTGDIRVLGPELHAQRDRDGLDVARFLLAGASAVQVATSVIVDGFTALTKMLDELTEYLARGALDARDIVGQAADAVMTYEEAAMRSSP